MVAGNTGNYAVSGANTLASMWGGGLGFWLGCMNATSYTGLSFAIRGTTPTGNASVTLGVDGSTSGYTAEIAITDTWATQQLPFASFADDSGVAATGDNINGLNVGASMTWVASADNPEMYVVEAAPYEIQLDDLAFY
jgi:hypothetical protein